MKPDSRRIHSLDGLRAVSILAVLLGHAAGTSRFPDAFSAAIQNQFVDVANLGVRCFFVFCGFLITRLLLNEYEQTHSISLPRFYLRRSVRIFPAYFAFIGISCVAATIGWVAIAPADLVHALTYTINYAPNTSWAFGHLWSLSVEEQFYLLWPCAFCFFKPRRAALVACAAIFTVPFIRVAETRLPSEWWPLIDSSFEATADALAIGCLLALLREKLAERSWYRALIASRWMIAVLLVCGLLCNVRWRLALLLGLPLTNLAIALAIDQRLTASGGPIYRMLNYSPVAYVGTLSYSIYLWQQHFLNRSSDAMVTSWPLNLALVAVAALSSYYLVERPFLKWRPKLEQTLFGSHRVIPAVRRSDEISVATELSTNTVV